MEDKRVNKAKKRRKKNKKTQSKGTTDPSNLRFEHMLEALATFLVMIDKPVLE